MPLLWLILGVIALVIGLAGFYYQELERHADWSWSQLHTIESAVSVAIAIGIVLILVAVIEYIWRRRSR